MSCHGCATKYTFFNKENGCPNCGFSFCNKCLKYKAVIPKLGKSEQFVCKSCFVALTDLEAKSKQQDHPAVFLQRLESLENPSRPPITIYQHDQRMQQLKTGLTQTDREIADRLERLREDRKRGPLPSEDEIAQRLALLKGEDPERISSTQSKTISCSQQQQAENLIQQFQEEQQLKLKHPTPEEDITSRLAKLRGLGTPATGKTVTEPAPGVFESTSGSGGEPNSLDTMSLSEANALLAQFQEEEKCAVGEHNELETSAKKCLNEIKSRLMKKGHKKRSDVLDEKSSESDTENEAIQQVIQQAMEEAALDEKMSLSDSSDGTNSENYDQPGCVICDENATLQCLGCSRDQYCNSCFKEHQDEMKDHKAIPFNPPKK